MAELRKEWRNNNFLVFSQFSALTTQKLLLNSLLIPCGKNK